MSREPKFGAQDLRDGVELIRQPLARALTPHAREAFAEGFDVKRRL